MINKLASEKNKVIYAKIFKLNLLYNKLYCILYIFNNHFTCKFNNLFQFN